MNRILIVYDSTEGQTEKIAHYMGRLVESAGHDVAVLNDRDLPANVTVDSFDGVILGASIHYGKHSQAIADFVTRHLSSLNSIPSGFFSVSLAAAGSDEHRREAEEMMTRFLEDTEWSPQVTLAVAGALLYRQYGFFKRIMMKMIVSQGEGDTDTSRNYEYTDWDAIDLFVCDLLQRVGSPLDQQKNSEGTIQCESSQP